MKTWDKVFYIVSVPVFFRGSYNFSPGQWTIWMGPANSYFFDYYSTFSVFNRADNCIMG